MTTPMTIITMTIIEASEGVVRDNVMLRLRSTLLASAKAVALATGREIPHMTFGGAHERAAKRLSSQRCPLPPVACRVVSAVWMWAFDEASRAATISRETSRGVRVRRCEALRGHDEAQV